MKTNKWVRLVVVTMASAVALLCFGADDEKENPANLAWKEVLKALRPPPQPADWRTNQPSKEQIAEYERKNGVLAGQAADKVKDFYTKYPNHAKAKEAQSMEIQLLSVAIQLGDTNRQTQLDVLRQKRLSDPSLSAEEKFTLRAQEVVKMLMNEDTTNRAPLLERAEKTVRDLQRDFPKREETHELLLMVARSYVDLDNVQRARSITEEVVKNASGDAKEQALGELHKLDLVGKRLELKFTDLTGKDINLRNHIGKVVLVDFWATWCGPCRAALPEVKETYAKFHSKGFEIVGISFDKDKEALTQFVGDENMVWPQYFDGLGWENKIGQKYEISSIPTVWLVDKKGNLRDINGRQSLAAKVERLLGE